MAGFGYTWRVPMLRRAHARGERFEARANDPVANRDDLPPP